MSFLSTFLAGSIFKFTTIGYMTMIMTTIPKSMTLEKFQGRMLAVKKMGLKCIHVTIFYIFVMFETVKRKIHMFILIYNTAREMPQAKHKCEIIIEHKNPKR